jgi:hypothetical protein
MGRTLPTFNMYLEGQIGEWGPFRRALRREDREAFDRLFAFAKRHMAEAAAAARPVPFDSMLMAILLEQQKTIDALQRRLDESDAKR